MEVHSMHLDEELIQRFIAGELTERSAPADHLRTCTECREAVARADQEWAEVGLVLRKLDHRPPPIEPQSLAERAHTRTRQGMLRWAAAILLTVGVAGAAYAAPGSPLRAWIHAVLARATGSPATQTAPPAPTPEGTLAGIAIPAGQNLVILFTSTQTAGQASISLTDSGQVVVRALNGAATFTSDVDRLAIENSGSSANFDIRIPRTAERVEIRVAGQRVFLKEGAHITASGSPATGDYFRVPLASGGP
jgi:anti-sigma factor RsiW